jgi:NAD(P)-dependent dehydrogenase (short-subunit alcohol dehydrogenase family)
MRSRSTALPRERPTLPALSPRLAAAPGTSRAWLARVDPIANGGRKMERDPRTGPKPAEDVETQEPPGREAKLSPRADHGEETYTGSGRLAGLAAIITGGDSGIGRAVAIAFAREGADVAFSYRDEMEDEDARETRRLVQEAGRRCFSRRFDVGDASACRAFVADVVAELGGLHILVNNAAEHTARESIEEIPEAQLERTFRTNVFGVFFMIQAALPELEPGAVIINTGSVTGLQGHPGLLDYAATKGAVHNLTQSLAGNLSERGIRVNCVAPGPVWTPLINSTFDEDQVRSFGEDTEWQRPAQPAELAPAFVFLASAEARYITGETIGVTGRGSTR